MQFCTKCGAKLEDDARFCEACGAPVEEPESAPQPAASQPAAPQAPVPHKNSETMKKVVDFVKKNRIAVSIVAVVVVVAIVLGIFFATRPLTVDLNKYVSVEFDGYDTLGTASFQFNTTKFQEDYGDRIQKKSKNVQNLDELLSEFLPSDVLLEYCVDGSFDKDHHLTNGDTVTFQWDCDDSRVEEAFNIRLSYEDLSYTVEGLKEARTVDPFADLEFNFSGVSPNAQISYQNKSTEDYANWISFKVSKTSELKNGDTVTFAIHNAESADWEENLLKRYGVILSQTEKTVTVEGLESYVSGLSEIDTDALAKMQQQAEDVMEANASRWNDGITLKETQYVGSHLLTAKDPSAFGMKNTLYLVYKVTAHVTLEGNDSSWNPQEAVDEDVSYFVPVRFHNITVKDNTVNVDINNYHVLPHNFIKNLGGHNLSMSGYETLDELAKDCVTVNADRYNSENNIDASN